MHTYTNICPLILQCRQRRLLSLLLLLQCGPVHFRSIQHDPKHNYGACAYMCPPALRVRSATRKLSEMYITCYTRANMVHTRNTRANTGPAQSLSLSVSLLNNNTRIIVMRPAQQHHPEWKESIQRKHKQH